MAALVGSLCLASAVARDGRATVDRQTTRALLEREGCQMDLPREDVAGRVPGSPYQWRGPEIEPLVPPVVSGLANALSHLLIVVALAGGLALLIWMLPRRRAREPVAPGTGQSQVRSPAPRAVPDHERLAQQGRFAEAIHALLLRAFVDLGRRTSAPGLAASRSSTSREVLHSTSPELRQALAPLVGSVERVHFGAGSAGIEDYTACVGQYRSFAAACRTRA
jgi:hypothetical protein